MVSIIQKSVIAAFFLSAGGCTNQSLASSPEQIATSNPNQPYEWLDLRIDHLDVGSKHRFIAKPVCVSGPPGFYTCKEERLALFTEKDGELTEVNCPAVADKLFTIPIHLAFSGLSARNGRGAGASHTPVIQISMGTGPLVATDTIKNSVPDPSPEFFTWGAKFEYKGTGGDEMGRWVMQTLGELSDCSSDQSRSGL